ncbi:hypothetical protein V3C99_015679 [Haemonchus contortus]|uniref:BMERB domain-containing protein n=1 Tax=Haemonchus contortus TaxID=6289 RepID=A0A7I4YVN2_HAECO
MLVRLEQKIDERFDQFSQQQERCINRLTDPEPKVKETWDHCLQKQEEIKDLEDKVVFEHSDDGGVDDNNNDRQIPTTEEERLDLEHRLNVLKKLVELERKVRERKINMHDLMQDRDCFSDVRPVSQRFAL